ncbi:MAG: hypothetical protein L3K10_01665 [Thermoplasmata archaeon]|nr:hypothetical protein [Thermoplasmata archaeon]
MIRLHHHRVTGEVGSAESLASVEEADPPRVLILVADGEGELWPHELGVARARQAGLLPLLIVPETTPDLLARARRLGVRAILNRPFAIRDLVSAVEAVARGEELLAGGPGSGRADLGPR